MGYLLGNVQHRDGVISLEQRGNGIEIIITWGDRSTGPEKGPAGRLLIKLDDPHVDDLKELLELYPVKGP